MWQYFYSPNAANDLFSGKMVRSLNSTKMVISTKAVICCNKGLGQLGINQACFFTDFQAIQDNEISLILSLEEKILEFRKEILEFRKNT